jgi:CBS domain-containing protein
MKTVKRVASSNKDPMKVNVASIMTKKVKTARPDTSLEMAIDLMVSKEIGHLPVVDDDGVLKGIVSKSDLIRERFLDGDTHEVDHRAAVTFLDELLSHGFHEEVEVRRNLSDIMSTKVRTVKDTSTVAQAAVTMAKYRVHGLPVVSEKNVLVGFISTFDIVSWVASN